MNLNQNPKNDEDLRAVLREWVVDTSLPSRFQDRVWQRIEQAETRPESRFWAQLASLVETTLPHPKIAFSYFASLLVLGILAGSMTAQVKSNRLNSDLSTRYVQSVDPYQKDFSQP